MPRKALQARSWKVLEQSVDVFVSRLVNEGHVPYVNAYEDLPDEMKLEGKDALIFRVEVRNPSAPNTDRY